MKCDESDLWLEDFLCRWSLMMIIMILANFTFTFNTKVCSRKRDAKSYSNNQHSALVIWWCNDKDIPYRPHITYRLHLIAYRTQEWPHILFHKLWQSFGVYLTLNNELIGQSGNPQMEQQVGGYSRLDRRVKRAWKDVGSSMGCRMWTRLHQSWMCCTR